MLYTWNYYNVICQRYLNKKVIFKKITSDKILQCHFQGRSHQDALKERQAQFSLSLSHTMHWISHCLPLLLTTNCKKFSMSAFLHSSDFKWRDLIYCTAKVVAFSNMLSKIQAVTHYLRWLFIYINCGTLLLWLTSVFLCLLHTHCVLHRWVHFTVFWLWEGKLKWVCDIIKYFLAAVL